MTESISGIDCRKAFASLTLLSFLGMFVHSHFEVCLQSQQQTDVISFCLCFKTTRSYCANCTAINNNLEPGAYKYKGSLRKIRAGMKKALYICQALTAVILFTWWDLQGQAWYRSCSCVSSVLGSQAWWCYRHCRCFVPEANNIEKGFPRGVSVKFLVYMDTTVSLIKTAFVFQAFLTRDQWFKTGESIISSVLTHAYPRAIFFLQMNPFQPHRCCTDVFKLIYLAEKVN